MNLGKLLYVGKKQIRKNKVAHIQPALCDELVLRSLCKKRRPTKKDRLHSYSKRLHSKLLESLSLLLGISHSYQIQDQLHWLAPHPDPFHLPPSS